ncbi:unnamed protein product [Lepeophtheirus salmonis]|uniref:(salmon louse) hypothetical protein n=1 Tax=Lepeophtheirus salmonis TaxID=72036 RepID=A0A7R8CG31_LEPSM|nr:unnamed protein product [Lepeophtheirus salmonis]CAF2771877.1 unnamed protein product [Lepeophtheirus salmonis]
MVLNHGSYVDRQDYGLFIIFLPFTFGFAFGFGQVSSEVIESQIKIFINEQQCLKRMICVLGASTSEDSNFVQNFHFGLSKFLEDQSFKHLSSAWEHGSLNRNCSEVQEDHCQGLSDEQLIDSFSSLSSPPPLLNRQKRGLGFIIRDLRQHPLKVPQDPHNVERCQESCEAKRSACFLYSIGTYGACFVASKLAGTIGSIACSVITLPRSIDCTLHSYFNCFRRNCGYNITTIG